MRVVQAKIQDIEQKMTKSPRDEAELAQLQTKQQHILSTGKPIEGTQNQSFSPQQGISQTSQQVLFSFGYNRRYKKKLVLTLSHIVELIGHYLFTES